MLAAMEMTLSMAYCANVRVLSIKPLFIAVVISDKPSIIKLIPNDEAEPNDAMHSAAPPTA